MIKKAKFSQPKNVKEYLKYVKKYAPCANGAT